MGHRFQLISELIESLNHREKGIVRCDFPASISEDAAGTSAGGPFDDACVCTR